MLQGHRTPAALQEHTGFERLGDTSATVVDASVGTSTGVGSDSAEDHFDAAWNAELGVEQLGMMPHSQHRNLTARKDSGRKLRHFPEAPGSLLVGAVNRHSQVIEPSQPAPSLGVPTHLAPVDSRESDSSEQVSLGSSEMPFQQKAKGLK